MLCIAAVMRRECPLWGFQRTFREVRPMSALPPKADVTTFGYSERQLGKMILYGLCHQVPAAITMPSNTGSYHCCDHHDEDGRVHAASMCDTPQARHSKV